MAVIPNFPAKPYIYYAAGDKFKGGHDHASDQYLLIQGQLPWNHLIDQAQDHKADAT